ncbi:MAG TPA: aminotransferase class V-fold PLP-dependent enzyme, partial [Spirochaetes bacterium]|nr:aminotransferase class V-fold PLP-dependent enzyme [Spirochaetota bacterium]
PPSGKFEIASTILEEHGYDPLPVYKEPQEGPLTKTQRTQEYPLVFNSGSRVTTDFRSQHHGIPGLYKERPEPVVTINRVDAEIRDIKNGDLVRIDTVRGTVTMRAFVSDDIIKGSIDANMGGGGPVGPKAWQECNINELTNLQHYDPISGFPVYKALLCEVAKVERNDETALKNKDINIDSGEYNNVEVQQVDPLPDRIYLDHNATTPIDPEVREAMIPYMEGDYGNPSSIYSEGKKARMAVENARRSLGQLLNCTSRRIVFTGCGSEANNLVLKGVAFANRHKNHIITTSIEHPSVFNTCKWLEKQGVRVTYLEVDETGRVHPESLLSAITENTCLVSIMTANNETGSIQPIAELANIAREHAVLFHTDSVQAIGKIPVNVSELGIDFLTLSGHKLHGPKGVGALYIRKDLHFEPLIHGGEQEVGLRAGTENVTGIVGFGKACELALQRLSQMDELRVLRVSLEQGIKELLPSAKLNGHPEERLSNTLNMTLPGIRGESMVLTLDQKGVSLSSGSACTSGSPKPSRALLAMGLSEEEAHCAVRFSLGFANTKEDIDRSISLIGAVIRESKSIVRFVPCR